MASFGTAPDNGDDAPGRTITVTNNTSCPAPMSETISGANAANYTVSTNSCGSSLAASPATCKYTVTFTANALGEFDADLFITASGDPHSPYDVTLVGDGEAP